MQGIKLGTIPIQSWPLSLAEIWRTAITTVFNWPNQDVTVASTSEVKAAIQKNKFQGIAHDWTMVSSMKSVCWKSWETMMPRWEQQIQTLQSRRICPKLFMLCSILMISLEVMRSKHTKMFQKIIHTLTRFPPWVGAAQVCWFCRHLQKTNTPVNAVW